MKFKKALMLSCGVSVFSALVCLPSFNSFAFDGTHVFPFRLIFDKCNKSKKFTEEEDVWIKARNLFPNKTVDVYIIPNKIWKFGAIIDSDMVVARYDLMTDSRGRIPCTKIWEAPLTAGWYDIVVDVNQDGTYNHDDAVGNDAVFDRTDKPGLKVIP